MRDGNLHPDYCRDLQVLPQYNKEVQGLKGATGVSSLLRLHPAVAMAMVKSVPSESHPQPWRGAAAAGGEGAAD